MNDYYPLYGENQVFCAKKQKKTRNNLWESEKITKFAQILYLSGCSTLVWGVEKCENTLF